MRISRLDLLSYGKFTDKTIALPRAAKDFHLLVGPNEAGKSTLRNAIQDLLFGIETRSPFNFLHPYNEMRLGSFIEHETNLLDFIRSKGRNRTLQAKDGAILSDDALSSYLGQIDRIFFEQMYGLDHERLVHGGDEILSAANDIGRILFQAASGIGSLGDIRDKLENEADKLWAKNSSKSREYYIAKSQFEQAETALKNAVVRTKEWQEASSTVDLIDVNLSKLREEYATLEQERVKLERIRRVAPILTTLVEFERNVMELGEIHTLPEDAAQRLDQAESILANAMHSQKLFEEQALKLQEQIENLHPNIAMLKRKEDIESLSDQRQLLRNHERDIEHRKIEIKSFWQVIELSTKELGWPTEDEAQVNQLIPSSLIRSTISSLIRQNDSLKQKFSNTEDALSKQQDEINNIDHEITGLSVNEYQPTLVTSLSTARSLGDTPSQKERNQAQIKRLSKNLGTIRLELGVWDRDVNQLKTINLPTPDETTDLINRYNELSSKSVTFKERITQANSDLKLLELEIKQYQKTHQLVTLIEVQHARGCRDQTWQAIKTGDKPIAAAASSYEQEIDIADTLSDQRHDKAKEESELLSKANRLEQLQLTIDDLKTQQEVNEQDLNGFIAQWNDCMQGIGLPGMGLLKVNHWRQVRDQVINADAELVEAQTANDALLHKITYAEASLAEALSLTHLGEGQEELPTLIQLADEMVASVTRTQEQRKNLEKQKTRAEDKLPEIRNLLAQAKTALEHHEANLKINLELAHLHPDLEIGAIEKALGLMETMDKNLEKIRDTRANRIDMMQSALDDFTKNAKELALDISPDFANDKPEQISLLLSEYLKKALSEDQGLSRLKTELESALKKVSDAKNNISDAQASLEPLLHICGAINKDELRVAVQNSDRMRKIAGDIDHALKQLLQTGDGLNREALRSEFEAVEFDTIESRLVEINAEINRVVEQQNQLSGELNSARQALAKIAGQDEAARAESQRQEALAGMANAAERFIKVFVAAKMLRWAIERYREKKQGPMLSKASEIFCGLTINSFNRLVVDHDSEPPRLSGQRSTGQYVSIEGMSDGTRDQLYLALRLAALEMHLEKTPPIPFIADDLFINYDNDRAKAGLEALAKLSEQTQVIFLSHHDHMVPMAQSVFGSGMNIVNLS